MRDFVVVILEDDLCGGLISAINILFPFAPVKIHYFVYFLGLFARLLLPQMSTETNQLITG